jgi:hypothetical protein
VRLELDKAADCGRGVFAHREPYAFGRFIEAATFDGVNAHGDAVAALALLADFDEAGQCHGRNRVLQNRMDDVRGAERRGGKAERKRKADRTAARQDRDCNGDERQRRGRPPGRLTIRREINDDAEAEGNRHPRH